MESKNAASIFDAEEEEHLLYLEQIQIVHQKDQHLCVSPSRSVSLFCQDRFLLFRFLEDICLYPYTNKTMAQE